MHPVDVLIRNNESFQILPDLRNVRRQFRTVNDDYVVSGGPVLVELPGAELWRNMKFYFVEGSGGSVAEINVPFGYSPFGSDFVFHVPENPEQDRFGDEMFVGLARKLGQVVRIRHSIIPPGGFSSACREKPEVRL